MEASMVRLDCSTIDSINTSLCCIFGIDSSKLLSELNKVYDDGERDIIEIGKNIYDNLFAKYTPVEELEVIWFHGTLTDDPCSFKKKGISPSNKAYSNLYEKLFNIAKQQYDNVNESGFCQPSAKSTFDDEGPYGYLINLNLYDGNQEEHDYAKLPEGISDITSHLLGNRSNELNTWCENNWTGCDVWFIGDPSREYAVSVDKSISKNHYIKELIITAIAALKRLESGLHPLSNKAIRLDGCAVPPENIIDVKVVSR